MSNPRVRYLAWILCLNLPMLACSTPEMRGTGDKASPLPSWQAQVLVESDRPVLVINQSAGADPLRSLQVRSQQILPADLITSPKQWTVLKLETNALRLLLSLRYCPSEQAGAAASSAAACMQRDFEFDLTAPSFLLQKFRSQTQRGNERDILEVNYVDASAQSCRQIGTAAQICYPEKLVSTARRPRFVSMPGAFDFSPDIELEKLYPLPPEPMQPR